MGGLKGGEGQKECKMGGGGGTKQGLKMRVQKRNTQGGDNRRAKGGARRGGAAKMEGIKPGGVKRGVQL